MKNLETFGVEQLSSVEISQIEGGLPLPTVLTIIGMTGAAMAWAFDKGQELGEALASN